MRNFNRNKKHLGVKVLIIAIILSLALPLVPSQASTAKVPTSDAVIGDLNLEGDPEFDSDSISNSDPNQWRWLSYPGSRLVFNPETINIPIPLNLSLKLGFWVGNDRLVLDDIWNIKVAPTDGEASEASSASSTWYPYRIAFSADYAVPSGTHVTGYDFFYDVNSFVRVVEVNGSTSKDLIVNGTISGNGGGQWLSEDKVILVSDSKYYYVIRIVGLSGEDLEPIELATSPTIGGSTWTMRVPYGDETGLVGVSFGFATRSEGQTKAILRAKQALSLSVADSLTNTKFNWDMLLKEVPSPAIWGIDLVLDYGVTSEQHRRNYYAAWAFLLSNLTEILPDLEYQYPYPQVYAGKPSNYTIGLPNAKATASWDSLFGYEWLAYLMPDVAWKAYEGLIAQVESDGKLSGESLPSRKAETAWFLYNHDPDKYLPNLKAIYPNLRKYLLWNENNLRWTDVTDEKDSEYLISWLVDVDYAIKIANEIGKTDDINMWLDKQRSMIKNYRDWYFAPEKIYQYWFTDKKVHYWGIRTEDIDYMITTGLAIKNLPSDLLARLEKYYLDIHNGSEVNGGFAKDVKYPDMSLTLRGLLDKGMYIQAKELANAALRDVIRATEFSENTKPDATPGGVMPSIFSACALIEYTWLTNNVRIDSGLPMAYSVPLLPGDTGNLALDKPAQASSSEGSGRVPYFATDGNLDSRWASEGGDTHWIYVDLGSSQSINKVILRWETAYGKSYQIQVSDDAANWTDVYSTTTGDGGVDEIDIDPTNARYVRMYGTERGTSFGYSLWEFEVYNTSIAPTAFDLLSPGRGGTSAVNTVPLYWQTKPDTEYYEIWIDDAKVAEITGSTTSTYTTYITEALKSGNHIWYVVAVDSFGNKMRSTNISSFAVEEPISLPDWVIGPFVRWGERPVLEPKGTGWESVNVYNPGVIVEDDIFKMLYRAEGSEDTSRIGFAQSNNGFNFDRNPDPVMDATESYEIPGGLEDPRLFKLSGTYYAYYTCYHGAIDLCVATSTDLVNWTKQGPKLTNTKNGAVLVNPDNVPVQINGKYVMYFGDSEAKVAYSTDLINWTDITPINMGFPDSYKPWEICYAVSNYSTSNPDDILVFVAGKLMSDGSWNYAISETLFSKNDLTRKKAELRKPILKPVERYETKGTLDNAVFMNTITSYSNKWWMYYGAADRYTALAQVIPTSNPISINLALNKRVTVSSEESSSVVGFNAVDGEANSRWASEHSNPQWIYVDLGSEQTINQVVIRWESSYGKSYKIQVSDDAINWTDVYATDIGDGGIDDIRFPEVNARYVRMYGTVRGTDNGYSLFEFEVYYVSNLLTNLAKGKNVSTSSNESDNVPGYAAVDGNGGTRWASASSDTEWIYVDLGIEQSINSVILKWESAYGKSYKIQVSKDATNWTDVYATTTGDGGTDDISFPTTSTRYVRMYGIQRGTGYGYSLYEFEVYGNVSSPVQVDLSSYYNVDAFSYNTNRYDGAYDGSPNSYSADEVQINPNFENISYVLGPLTDGSNNAISAAGQIIMLPTRSYSSIRFLGSATNGDQNGTFKIVYADGSYTETNITMKDWCTSDTAGQKVVQTMDHRHHDGNDENVNCHIFAYYLNVDPQKTISSIQLPNNKAMKLLAMKLVPRYLNNAPVANNMNVETSEDTAVDITLDASDVDEDPLTAIIVTEPAHGEVSLEGLKATYTPAADYNGTDNFTYKVNDGSTDSNSATVSITIAPVNDAPVAEDIEVETEEDTLTEIVLAASDVDEDPLTAIIVTEPAHGEVSLEGLKATYTPAANYNGADSFTFKVNDGTVDSNAATVSIMIAAVNDAPVANDISVEVDEDIPIEITLEVSDVDNPIEDLEADISARPSHGTAVIDGIVITYTPAADYNGTDTFTFKVNDGELYSNIAMVSITVKPVNDAPVAKDISIETMESQAVEFNLIAYDPDEDRLSYTIVHRPEHGRVSCGGQMCIYTPATGWSGTDYLVFKANDGKLDSNEATVEIIVNQLPIFHLYLPFVLK